jgi:hypothetical protein
MLAALPSFTGGMPMIVGNNSFEAGPSGYLDSQGNLTNSEYMTYLDELEHQWTLTTAVARYENLRARDSFADPDDADSTIKPLDKAEALQLIALSEVITRKAGHGRQLAVRTARTMGASWAEVGQALGASRQSAWEAHTRWREAQDPDF